MTNDNIPIDDFPEIPNLLTELFSAPTLTMSKAEVFQKDDMTFICRSDIYASERLDDSQLMYSLDPPQDFLYSRNNGVFYGKAPRFEFNISCVAKLKGITKHSQVFTLFPKGRSNPRPPIHLRLFSS